MKFLSMWYNSQAWKNRVVIKNLLQAGKVFYIPDLISFSQQAKEVDSIIVLILQMWETASKSWNNSLKFTELSSIGIMIQIQKTVRCLISNLSVCLHLYVILSKNATSLPHKNRLAENKRVEVTDSRSWAWIS